MGKGLCKLRLTSFVGVPPHPPQLYLFTGLSSIRGELVLWTSSAWKCGRVIDPREKPFIYGLWEPMDKYFCLLFLGGHFYSVCFLEILAEMSPDCLQQWSLNDTTVLAFPLFCMHFFYSFTPSSWDQVQNILPEPSPCLRFSLRETQTKTTGMHYFALVLYFS